MKTSSTKQSDIQRIWHLIDLKDQVLGRVASQMAQLLMGKNKINQSPNLDGGDFVVAINANQIRVTGNKLDKKIYYRHSGYPGGFREETLGFKMDRDSRKVIELAVKGMLPKNKYQTPRLRRLRVFKDATHPHESQIHPNSPIKTKK